MDYEAIQLSDEELDLLDELFPEGNSSGVIGKRAEKIVELYLRRLEPDCEIEYPSSGADLLIRSSNGIVRYVEVKGTASAEIEWGKLKVSSQASHDSIVNDETPIYRICSVFEEEPRLCVLRHNDHFRLVPEPRWAIRPSRNQTVPGTLHQLGQGERNNRVRRSKYNALREYLRSQSAAEVLIAFKDFGRTVGIDLPNSAYEHQAYWANQTDTSNRPWAKAWTDAGYSVDGFKLGDQGWVRFRCRRSEP